MTSSGCAAVISREAGAGAGAGCCARLLREAAEERLVRKEALRERRCELPGVPRSTFLMAFSPDGTKVASTHGNHNVHVCELATGRHVRTLRGHPRTPWCVAFHPAHAQLLASGCLGGQVRVWDLSGGSEAWTVETESVIASIAFHPREQLLVIAAYNEIHFWDWSRPRPFATVQTGSIKARVRFVAFDALGHNLITGISCWPQYPQSQPAQQSAAAVVQPVPYHLPPQDHPGGGGAPPGGSPHEHIVSSYHHLVQRYNSLVRNYHSVVMGRAHPVDTTDRGTDPMEIDPPPDASRPDERPAEPSDRRPMTRSRTQGLSSNASASTSAAPRPTRSSDPPRSPRRAIPSTGRSAFRPVSESRSRIRRGAPRGPNSFRSGFNRELGHELSTLLSRLQGFMENSIDQTLNMWEMYDSSYRDMAALAGPASNAASGSQRNEENDDDSNSSSDARNSSSTTPTESERLTGNRRPDNDDQSANSESSNENADARRLSDIHNMLRFSGNRLLNFITAERNARQSELDDLRNGILPGRTRSATLANSLPGPSSSSSRERNIQTLSRAPNGASTNPSNPRISQSTVQTLSSANQTRNGAAEHDYHVANNTGSSGNNPVNAATNTPRAEVNGAAFERVMRGLEAIERHTNSLLNYSARGTPCLSRVRQMWEDLRRRIIAIQRSSEQRPGNYFTVPIAERLRLVDNATGNANPSTSSHDVPSCSNSQSTDGDSARTSRGPNSGTQLDSQINIMLSKTTKSLSNLQTMIENKCGGILTNRASGSGSSSASNVNSGETSRGETSRTSAASSQRSQPRRGRSQRQLSCRLRSILLRELSHRRNSMNMRRGEVEYSCDRIRTQARRILAIMFAVLMDCLEANQFLSSHIIAMLRSLKKALSITSLLLIAHLFSLEPYELTTGPLNPQHPRPAPPPPPRRGNLPAHPSPEQLNEWRNFRNLVATTLQQRQNDMLVHVRRFRLHPAMAPRQRRRPPFAGFANASMSNPNPQNHPQPPRGAPDDNETPSTSGTQRSQAGAPQQPPAAVASPEYFRMSRQLLESRVYRTHQQLYQSPRFFGRLVHNMENPQEFQNANELENLSRFLAGRESVPNGNAAPNVPLVHINDVPINEMNGDNALPHPPPPLYARGPEPVPPEARMDDDQRSAWSTWSTFRFITECPSSPVHRIQVWDFTQGQLPDITNPNKNIVVRKCKIHNDACIDISKDGRLLVALLPAQKLGIFSLEWNNLGVCLYTAQLEQNAVSVSLSPCTRHLAVGLGSRRVSLLPVGRNGIMAMIYRLGSDKETHLGSLVPVRSLEQTSDSGFTSLNCLRWAPQPGQGLVYANNTGQLKILS